MTTKIGTLKRKTRGGKRRNSGRKSVEDPKIQTSCYLLSSRIKSLGGMESIREIMIKAVEMEYQRSLMAEAMISDERNRRAADRMRVSDRIK